jgi:hypothetical protein
LFGKCLAEIQGQRLGKEGRGQTETEKWRKRQGKHYRESMTDTAKQYEEANSE